jgi:hypothetical protein
MATRNTLYRFYDSSDVLLYVGISMTPWERFRQHRHDKPWWDDIVTIRKEEYPSRDAVKDAERCAIVAERPLHNIQHNRRSFVDWDGQTREGAGRWRFAKPNDPPIYTVTSRAGTTTFGEFQLVYELDHDPISDDYYWDELDPSELFRLWHKRVTREHGETYVPIHWFVSGPGVFEYAQREQHGVISPRDGFQSYYHLPVDASGRRVLIEDLPIIDKRWDAQQADKGGFLPVATNWKPQPMQPSVSSQWLRKRATRRHAWVVSNGRWVDAA